MTTEPVSSIVRLQRRVGDFPIEFPAAALLAFAAAFVTLALPDWRFESMIAGSGLPDLVSAAEPPLGLTARLLVAAILGALSFAGVLWGLRALDRRPPEPDDFPAFRTADLHPDAPRRRPILAGTEFGTPEAVELDDRPSRRPLVGEELPSFLAPQPPAIGEFVHLPVAAEPDVAFDEIADAIPPAQPLPADPPLHRSKPIIRVAPANEAEPPTAVAPAATRTEPMPAFMQPQPLKSVASTNEAKPRARDRDRDSVSALMARLESGLARNGSPTPDTAPGEEELLRTLGDLDRPSRRSRP